MKKNEQCDNDYGCLLSVFALCAMMYVIGNELAHSRVKARINTFEQQLATLRAEVEKGRMEKP